MIELSKAQQHAINFASQQPGFQEALKVLDQITESIKEQAFDDEDDSRGMRLLHEGRGAKRLNNQFKAILADIAKNVRTPQNQ